MAPALRLQTMAIRMESNAPGAEQNNVHIIPTAARGRVPQSSVDLISPSPSPPRIAACRKDRTNDGDVVANESKKDLATRARKAAQAFILPTPAASPPILAPYFETEQRLLENRYTRLYTEGDGTPISSSSEEEEEVGRFKSDQEDHVSFLSPFFGDDERPSTPNSAISISIQSFNHQLDNLARLADECEALLCCENQRTHESYEQTNLNIDEDIKRNRAFFQQAVTKSLTSFNVQSFEDDQVESDAFDKALRESEKHHYPPSHHRYSVPFPPRRRLSSMALAKGRVNLVVSNLSLLEDCQRLGKTLYLIQNKPLGYPEQDLWSSNLTLDTFLASPGFENLDIRTKNNVLRSVHANFLIEAVENGKGGEDDLADELGQDYHTAQHPSGETPTLPASSGSMNASIASVRYGAEWEDATCSTSHLLTASPAKSQHISTLLNDQPSSVPSNDAQSGRGGARPLSQAVASPSRSQISSLDKHSMPQVQLKPMSSTGSFGGLSQRSKSPSKFSVVIGSSRTVATPQRDQKLSALRIELPSNTPEKLLSKQLPLNPFISNQGQGKKRGRPFQSKEAEEKARLKALIREQKADGTYVHKSKQQIGRPARTPPKHFAVPVPEFQFAVFRCKFAGCPAQLFNMETLKKHVHIVHGKRSYKKSKESEKYSCTWEGCYELADEQPSDDLEVEPIAMPHSILKWKTEFDTWERWREHVDDDHMEYVRWTQGDGPTPQDLRQHSQPAPRRHANDPPDSVRKPHSLYEREPWLFDKNGQKFIPEINLSRVYHESPNQHYTKLFKRTRDEDGDWIYSLKEGIEALPSYKKNRLFKDDNGQSNSSAPQDIEEEDSDEEQTGTRFMSMQICQ